MTKHNKIFFNKKMGMDISYDQMPFPVTVSQRVSNTYHCDIKDVLTNLSDVDNVLTAMRMATEDDEIIIYLNCLGGSASVLSSVLMAMDKCEAPIHVEVSGTCASAATFILLNAASFEVADDTEFLFHAPSYGSAGEMADVKRHVDFVHKQSDKLLRTHYKYFFSEEEITKIIEDKFQWWMGSDEFIERYKKRNELMAEELAAETSSLVDEDLLTEEELEEWEKITNSQRGRIANC